METHITMSELRQCLGDWVNRAAYKGERIVLVSHGKVKAAIIGVQDLQQLRQWSAIPSRENHLAHSLAAADAIRAQIQRWQAEHGIQAEDSTEVLRELREERDDHLSNLC